MDVRETVVHTGDEWNRLRIVSSVGCRGSVVL